MSENIKCHVCGAYATVHLTQILNNQIHKIDLCESCAQKKGVLNDEGFALSELVAKNLNIDTPTKESAIQCQFCGLTVAQLKKNGRLGCAHCYQALKDILTPIIRNLHRNNTHQGKIPKNQEASQKKQKVEQTLLELNKQILQAVREERYEDAARFRDQMHNIQNNV